VLAIVRALDFQQPLPDAIAGPRFHHQWRPNVVTYEKNMPPSVVDDWKARGHQVDRIRSGGRTQAVAALPSGKLIAVSDPRVPGKAAGD
jgi:gamma-glutamyltranspeptidase / glutathione hydrolase